MQRFFLDKNFGEILEITDTTLYNQITRVLRARIWDEFVFFNTRDNFDYFYKIEAISKNNVILKMFSREEKGSFLQEVNLYNALPNKYEKIEYILQKWVEVWISNFYFFKSLRSQNLKIDPKKIERFQKIIQEAVEQSWRNNIPKICFLDSLDLSKIIWENLFFHTKDQNSKLLWDLKVAKCTNLFVWPEWWFSPEEIENFEKHKFIKVFLKWNILRTETVWTVVSFYLRQA